MSYTSIPNQPIIFHTQEEILTPCIECGSNEYKQLIDFNDQIFFQLESTPCPLSVLYAYDTFQGGWGNNLEDNKICSDDITDGGIYEIYLTTNYIYQVYQVTFTILTLDEGTLNVEMYGSSSYQITLAGTYTLFFANPTITGNSVTLVFQTPNVDGWVGCLSTSGINVYGLASGNQMRVGIVDAETLETVDMVAPLYTVKDNKITAAFDLTDVELGAGCYRIAMTDFCTNTCGQSYVFNGVFRSQPRINVFGWTPSNALVTLSEGSAAFGFSLSSQEATITQNISNDLCDGLQYNVGVFIESRTNVRIYVKVGTEQVQVFGTGYQQVLITADGNNPLEILVQQFGGLPAAAILNYVDIQIAESDIQWDLYTDILDIGDYNDSCKYFKIEGCNAQDQFNLAFGGSSFLPMIRLEGKRSKAQYVTNANTFRYASGKWSANYVNRLKQWTYHFGRLPEYVLDFLSTIFYYDNCYVNGVLMFPQDNAFPTIDWQDADTYLGSFAIDLVEKENKVVKVQCGDSDADCLPSILDNSDEPFLLTQDLNRITTEESVNLYQEF